jgi:hypothetical protein
MFCLLACPSSIYADERPSDKFNDTISVSIDELNDALHVVYEYILNVKKENKENFHIEYEEMRIGGGLEERILRFSENGEFKYDIFAKRIIKRNKEEYDYIKNTYMFNVMSNHQMPKGHFGNDGKSFHLEIDKRTMQVIKELKFQ